MGRDPGDGGRIGGDTESSFAESEGQYVRYDDRDGRSGAVQWRCSGSVVVQWWWWCSSAVVMVVMVVMVVAVEGGGVAGG